MFDILFFLCYTLYMKLDIEIGILITLLNKGKTTYKSLSNKFNVSTRTICRYISALDTAGIPIFTKTGKNGGVQILNTFKINNLYFTIQEKICLLNSINNISNKSIKQSLLEKLSLMEQ